MAASSTKTKCSICNDETHTFICRGCSQDFCFDHLTEHRQFLKEQFGLIQDDFNQFRQNIIDLKTNSEKHPLIKQIDQWENQSITIIKQKAKQCREELVHFTSQSIDQIETKLNRTNEQFFSNKKSKDLNEIDLNELKEKLKELNEQLHRPSNISIERIPNSFIQQISLRFHRQKNENFFIPNLNSNQTWKQHSTRVAANNGQGNQLNQLCWPWGMSIDNDETIYIADSGNDRIVEWKKNSNNGQIVAGGNGQGNRNDQLNCPTAVIIDEENDSLIICDRNNRRVVRWPRRNGRSGEILISNIDCFDLLMDNAGYLYVSDVEKDEIRRWKIGENNGTIVAGGNGKGNRLDQLDYPFYIFIDEDHSVYVSDWNNDRVMKWLKGAREGIVVAGGQGRGNGLRQLSNPQGIIVDHLGSVYVADGGNGRVMRWLKGAKEGTIVVGRDETQQQLNQLNRPIDLSFDEGNNLYVLDDSLGGVFRFDVN